MSLELNRPRAPYAASHWRLPAPDPTAGQSHGGGFGHGAAFGAPQIRREWLYLLSHSYFLLTDGRVSARSCECGQVTGRGSQGCTELQLHDCGGIMSVLNWAASD